VLLGYNTNGLAFHRLQDALRLIAETGFKSVALTLDYQHLDPTDRESAVRAAASLRPLIGRLGLRVTIETGARFILDPRHKHQPTLISAKQSDRRRRIELLKTAIDVAATLQADSVSLWSGGPDDEDEAGARFQSRTSNLRRRLLASLTQVLQHARRVGVKLAFEPEPGMFIDRMAGYASLCRQLDDPLFGLTLDVGHVHCLNDGDVCEHIRAGKDRLWNVHVADMRRGVHEHLMFGEGQIDFAPIFQTLREIEYAGPVHVELSRHSYDAVRAMQQAWGFVKRLES